MFSKIVGTVLVYIFRKIFRTTKETAETAKDDLTKVFAALSSVSARRLREFLAAIPIFVEFVIHLVKERDKIEKSRQIIIIGAAAALSTLLGGLLVSVLGSWAVQLTLILSFPLVGIPLFLSTGLALTAVVVLFAWLVIFVLNQVLADDPAYQSIRDAYLPPEDRRLLFDIDDAVMSRHGESATQLYKVVGHQLGKQGSSADIEKVSMTLDKVQNKLSKDDSSIKRLKRVVRRTSALQAVKARVAATAARSSSRGKTPE